MFVPFERGMNTLQSRYKLFHFNLTMSPLCLVKLKIAQNSLPFTAVHSVEQIVTNFRRKSFSVPLFPSLLENSYSMQSSDKKFTFSWVFIEHLSSNSIWFILTCKLKLNCGDLRCVTVMKPLSN